MKRYCTDKEAFNEFVVSWGTADRHTLVSKDEFISYYNVNNK